MKRQTMPSRALPPPRDEKVARLKRELARVKKEHDFLRETAVFFAKVSAAIITLEYLAHSPPRQR